MLTAQQKINFFFLLKRKMENLIFNFNFNFNVVVFVALTKKIVTNHKMYNTKQINEYILFYKKTNYVSLFILIFFNFYFTCSWYSFFFKCLLLIIIYVIFLSYYLYMCVYVFYNFHWLIFNLFFNNTKSTKEKFKKKQVQKECVTKINKQFFIMKIISLNKR